MKRAILFDVEAEGRSSLVGVSPVVPKWLGQ